MNRTIQAQLPPMEIRSRGEILEKGKLRGELSPNRQPDWLYAAVRDTVHRQRGTAKVIADALACPEPHVTDLADPLRRAPLKAYEVPAMVKATGSLAILSALAAQCGCVVFELPVSPNPNDADLIRHTAKTVQEFGEALSQVSASIADGTITATERERIDVEIRDVHAALALLQTIVAQRAA